MALPDGVVGIDGKAQMARERPGRAGYSTEVQSRAGVAAQGIQWVELCRSRRPSMERRGSRGGEVVLPKKREAKHAVGMRGRSIGRWFHRRKGRSSTPMGAFSSEWRESEHARGGLHGGEVVLLEKMEVEHASGGGFCQSGGRPSTCREDCTMGRWFHQRRGRPSMPVGGFSPEWREAKHARGGLYDGEVVSPKKREAEHASGGGFRRSGGRPSTRQGGG